jgi:SAM-dependent methyltransferase
MWANVAPGWAHAADDVDTRGMKLTERLLDGADVGPGDRVLELACGPGGAGLAAAERVGPDGEVVLSDVVPGMVAIADARRRERGLEQVTTAVLDLEDIDRPAASFDVVLCREGLMFAVEPYRAVAEIHRVLRSAGRAAISVWGVKADNPWLGIVIDEVGSILGRQIPPPGMPGPFALGDPGRLQELLNGAGFADVAIADVAVPLRPLSFEAWWARMTEIAGPVSGIIARLEPGDKTRLEDRLRAAIDPYTTGAGLELPGRALLAWGRKP